MFAFKRPKVINQLTQKINNDPNTTVKDVLSNNDLSPSIRNEVPELLDFFCPPLPSPPNPERQLNSDENIKKLEEHQEELSILAFTSKLNQKNQKYEKDTFFRFNRNASNILSSPSKKFHDRLVYYYNENGQNIPSPFMKYLISFAISMKAEKSCHHNYVFYGHFHRIFEAIIRSSKGQFFDVLYTLEVSLKPFYSILLRKLNITSIRQLYVTCSSEYPHQFAGKDQTQDPSEVFIRLSEFGKNQSERIQGKKQHRIIKTHIKKSEFKEFSSEKNRDKNYSQFENDKVGFEKQIIDISKEKFKNHQKSEKVDKTIVEEKKISDKKRTKKTRDDYFQLVIASLLSIRDIINDSTEVVHYFRNKKVIENLFIIAKNVPESSFTVSLAYNLILRIATSNDQKLDDFKDIFKKYMPNYSNEKIRNEIIEKLKNRTEKRDDPQYESAGEHYIYQMPFCFMDLPDSFQDIFFSEKKYSDRFDEQYTYSIKHVLSPEDQIKFFTRANNRFLTCLCNALPNPPEIDLTSYSAQKTINLELPSVTKDSTPTPREPLRGHLWDIAKYIDDEKRFPNSSIDFKNGDEWAKLHSKVVEYYKRVYAYVGEPTDDEENEDQDLS